MSEESPELLIRRAEAADAELIAAVAADTFPLACPVDASPDDMSAYIQEHLSSERFLAELETTGVAAYLAFEGDRAVGYALLRGDNEPPVAAEYRRAANLRRLYVQGDDHGKGVSHALLRRVIRHARTHDYDFLWLGSNKDNARALAFYERHKFEIIGEREFQLGSSVQNDYVLARPIDRPKSD